MLVENSVSPAAREVMDLLLQLPMASERDLAGFSDMKNIYRTLTELRNGGLVDSVCLGWSTTRVNRYWLTEEALSAIPGADGVLHGEWGRCRLLNRLPSCEWFYRVAAELDDVDGLGPLHRFQWFEGIDLDAAAIFQRGWVLLCWSGLLEVEKDLFQRIESLATNMRRLSAMVERPWPSLICFVVSDEWQMELVNRVSRYQAMDDVVSVWCVPDSAPSGAGRSGAARSGAMELRPGRGRLHQVLNESDLGGWPWVKRLEQSPWSDDGSVFDGRVLDLIAEWPGILRRVAEAVLGGRTQKALKSLFDSRLLERVDSGNSFRYGLSSRGVHYLALRDRVHSGEYVSRSFARNWVNRASVQQHEDGVLNLMADFMSAGMPTAAGWRSVETFGPDGSIMPDGMVYLNQGPYGPGWHFLEYELTARALSKVKAKLKSYLLASRQNRWPVLVVSFNDRAEELFQSVGQGLPLSMLTTTLNRLKEHGPLGNSCCWSMYGQGVLIG